MVLHKIDVGYDYYLDLEPGAVAGQDARPVADSIHTSDNILSLRLVMKTFLRQFSAFR